MIQSINSFLISTMFYKKGFTVQNIIIVFYLLVCYETFECFFIHCLIFTFVQSRSGKLKHFSTMKLNLYITKPFIKTYSYFKLVYFGRSILLPKMGITHPQRGINLIWEYQNVIGWIASI